MHCGLRRLGAVAISCWSRASTNSASFISSLKGSSCSTPSTSQLMSSFYSGEEKKVVRVLALHGSEGTAAEFPSRLGTLKSTLANEFNLQMEITTVEGPFPKGEGYSWWTMKPGERSFNAVEYEGFDFAAEKVLEAWEMPPAFDLCLGHSQGAIMIASLIALNKVPYHPQMGYIFNGVSFPNPFRQQVGKLNFDESSNGAPRVLFVMGTNDTVTPNETGKELRDCFGAAGLEVETIKHPGGHGLPNDPDETVKAIANWLVNN